MYFFIYIWHNGEELSLALVLLYLNLDIDLLRLLHDTLWLCEYQGDSALKVIDIRIIKSVVVMIPYLPAIEGQEVCDHFFLVEKPGFDVALIVGTEESIPSDESSALERKDH